MATHLGSIIVKNNPGKRFLSYSTLLIFSDIFSRSRFIFRSEFRSEFRFKKKVEKSSNV